MAVEFSPSRYATPTRKFLLRDTAYTGLLVLSLYVRFWVFLRMYFSQGMLT